MDKKYLESILICPKCKNHTKKHKKKCTYKNSIYLKEGIWIFEQKNQDLSQKTNELRHKHGSWGRINDGSYEILASFAKGNKALDIASGEGWIEKINPTTVALDYSLNALKKAKKNGAQYLVVADAQNLPFKNDSFDITISSGSLENISNPQKAISEMARVSKIQIMIIHREFNFLTRLTRRIATNIFKIKHQAVENPLLWNEVSKMLKKSYLRIVYKGYWTLPINYGKPIKFLPVFKNIPSCFFLITTKTNS